MSGLPIMRFEIDVNMLKTANLASSTGSNSNVPMSSIFECVSLMGQITQRGGLVIDEGGEIFREYIRNLPQSGQPGVGDKFAKWVNDNQGKPQCDTWVSFLDKPAVEQTKYREVHGIGDNSIFDDDEALTALMQESFTRAAKKAVAENDALGIPTHYSVGGELKVHTPPPKKTTRTPQ
jgi:hypothetical protein